MTATSTDPIGSSPQIKPQYSGGLDVTNGEVGPLEADSFKDFCTRYLLTPIPVTITRAQYWSLDEKARQRWKSVAFFAAGFFPKLNYRKKKSITHCSLVALDIDNSNEARPLLKADEIGRRLPFNHFAYHSLSSTPEYPRIRVVIDAETFPAEDYHAAVHYVCGLLGVTGNTETLVCSQPMFRPTVFMLPRPDESFPAEYENSPVISLRLDGDPMPPVIPSPAGDQEDSDDGDFADMGNMRPAGADAPIPGLTRESIEGMLQHISPDCNRKEWMDVLCGLKHQFADDPATGLFLFNQWSEGATLENKYESYEKTKYIWDSYKVAPAGGGRPKTLRTARRMAQDNGWVDTSGPEDTIQRIRDAIQAASSHTDLTSTLLKEIACEKSLNEPARAGLILAVQDRLKKIGAKTPLPSLKQAVAKFREEAAKEARAASGLPAGLDGWAFVANLNRMVKVADPKNGIEINAFNMLITDRLECLEYSDDPSVTPATIARDHPAFPKVDRVGYSPERDSGCIYEEDGDLILNSYRDTGPTPDPERSEEAGKILLEHTRRMFPDERDAQILLSWLSYIVINPGCKIKWGVFIQGAQGCGKSFYADLMMAVLGVSNVNLIDRNMLEAKFNDWMFGAQLLVLDEIMTGDDRKKVMDKLKPVMTQDRIGLSQKHMSASPNLKNTANVLLLSNYEEGITIDEGDRRYFVLKSFFQSREQVKELPEGYFATLFSLTTTLAGAARHFLLNYAPSGEFDPAGTAPINADRGQVVEASMNTTQFAVKHVIGEGNHPLVCDDLLVFDALYAAIDGKTGPGLTAKALSVNLTRMGYVRRGQVSINGAIRTLWVSKTFCEALGDPAEVARIREKEAKMAGLPSE